MSFAAAVPAAERQRRLAFFYDVAAVGGRAIRSVRRDPEALIPALVIPIFFFVVNVGALQDFAESIPGIDYKAFQLPVGIIFAVTGMSRALVVVSDIQSGYFDRLSLTPVNRLALLLGLMVADMGMGIALSLPVLALAFVVGVKFEMGGIVGILGDPGVRRHRGSLGGSVLRVPIRDRLQDGELGGGEHQLPAVLPLRLPDDGLPAERGPNGLDVHHGDLQPGYLPA